MTVRNHARPFARRAPAGAGGVASTVRQAPSIHASTQACAEPTRTA